MRKVTDARQLGPSGDFGLPDSLLPCQPKRRKDLRLGTRMLLEHQGKSPIVAASAYIAPTAMVCGEVTIGDHSRILFGAIVTAEGGAVTIGNNSIVMENAVLRGSERHPLRLGNHVLVGPRAYLTGCTVEDEVFLATGVTIFNGARVGRGAEVRINGVVHIRTVLGPGTLVPIGWVAVGDPAQILPPNQHEKIWAVQQKLNFPQTVFGLERREDGSSLMPELTERYSRALGRHLDDRVIWTQPGAGKRE
jgi:carbonic anhydrase/acetyltransferase-like protein (isoleucine patch superfamily)